MFVVLQRRHYNKALLIMLSTFLHLQKDTSTMFETLRQNLVAFNKYACKHELHSFKSIFVPPRKFHFNSKKINKLNEKAAKFLTLKFEYLYYHLGMAVQQPRAHSNPST